MKRKFLVYLLLTVLIASFLSVPSVHASDTLIDSYATTNKDDQIYINSIWHNAGTDRRSAMTQTFTNDAGANYKITSAKFYLKKSGSPTGTAYIKLYSHSGTYGSTGVPNTLLATSAGLDISTVSSAAFTLYELAFSGADQYEMVSGTHYVICIGFVTSGTLDTSNFIQVGGDWSSPSFDGNAGWWYEYESAWKYNSGVDFCFYVYGVPAVTATSLFYSSQMTLTMSLTRGSSWTFSHSTLCTLTPALRSYTTITPNAYFPWTWRDEFIDQNARWDWAYTSGTGYKICPKTVEGFSVFEGGITDASTNTTYSDDDLNHDKFTFTYAASDTIIMEGRMRFNDTGMNPSVGTRGFGSYSPSYDVVMFWCASEESENAFEGWRTVIWTGGTLTFNEPITFDSTLWHVYQIQVSPEGTVFKIDGVTVKSTSAKINPSTQGLTTWIDNAGYGTGAPPYIKATITQTQYVDYIAFYQAAGSSNKFYYSIVTLTLGFNRGSTLAIPRGSQFTLTLSLTKFLTWIFNRYTNLPLTLGLSRTSTWNFNRFSTLPLTLALNGIYTQTITGLTNLFFYGNLALTFTLNSLKTFSFSHTGFFSLITSIFGSSYFALPIKNLFFYSNLNLIMNIWSTGIPPGLLDLILSASESAQIAIGLALISFCIAIAGLSFAIRKNAKANP